MDISEIIRRDTAARADDRRASPAEPGAATPAGQTLFDSSSLGATLRVARKENGLTLQDLSKRTGVSLSTLSRVETGHLTLSFERAHLLAEALEISFTHLLAETREQVAAPVQGWRSLSRAGEGRIVETTNFTYRYVCTDFLYRTLTTIFGVPKARTLKEHGPLVSHPGEELIHVLAGSIVLVMEHYEPLTLNTGDSYLFDSSTPHAILRDGDVEPLTLGCIQDPRNAFR